MDRPGVGAFMPLFREAVLGPAFNAGFGIRPSPKTPPDRPSVSPLKAARQRADRRTPIMHRSEPVLKDGPTTASRRRPLKRPQREPTELPALQNWSAGTWQGYDHSRPRNAKPAPPSAFPRVLRGKSRQDTPWVFLSLVAPSGQIPPAGTALFSRHASQLYNRTPPRWH